MHLSQSESSNFMFILKKLWRGEKPPGKPRHSASHVTYNKRDRLIVRVDNEVVTNVPLQTGASFAGGRKVGGVSPLSCSSGERKVSGVSPLSCSVGGRKMGGVSSLSCSYKNSTCDTRTGCSCDDSRVSLCGCDAFNHDDRCSIPGKFQDASKRVWHERSGAFDNSFVPSQSSTFKRVRGFGRKRKRSPDKSTSFKSRTTEKDRVILVDPDLTRSCSNLHLEVNVRDSTHGPGRLSNLSRCLGNKNARLTQNGDSLLNYTFVTGANSSDVLHELCNHGNCVVTSGLSPISKNDIIDLSDDGNTTSELIESRDCSTSEISDNNISAQQSPDTSHALYRASLRSDKQSLSNTFSLPVATPVSNSNGNEECWEDTFYFDVFDSSAYNETVFAGNVSLREKEEFRENTFHGNTLEAIPEQKESFSLLRSTPRRLRGMVGIVITDADN